MYGTHLSFAELAVSSVMQNIGTIGPDGDNHITRSNSVTDVA